MIRSQFDGSTALFTSKGYTVISDLLKKATFFLKLRRAHLFCYKTHTNK